MSRPCSTDRLAVWHRRRPTAPPRSAFTLLEVIIAVSLLLLVVGLMVGFGREMARSWEKLRGEHARFRELLALDRTLDGLLSSGVPFTWPNEDGEAVPFFVGEAAYLRVACLHPLTQVDDGSLRFAEVFVDDGALMVTYTARPYRGDEHDPDLVRRAVLAAGVDHVAFSYADWGGDDAGDWGDRVKWVDEWDPERKEIPLAILMTVLWQDGRVESWLRRLGSGYRERWGKWEPAKNSD